MAGSAGPCALAYRHEEEPGGYPGFRPGTAREPAPMPYAPTQSLKMELISERERAPGSTHPE